MFIGFAALDVDFTRTSLAARIAPRQVRLEFKTLREELNCLVPLHVEIGSAGLFPKLTELVERICIFVVGVADKFKCFNGFVFTDNADDVECTVDVLVVDSLFDKLVNGVLADVDVGSVLFG